MEIKGALSEIFCAFDEEGEIDAGKNADYIKFLLDRGVSGLFVGGIAAETMSFSIDERIEWLKTIRNAAGNTPIIFQINPSKKEEMEKEIKKAEEYADVISFSQPYPIPLSSGGIIDYFDALCSIVSKPVMLYNEPTIGKPIDLNTLNEIFSKNDKIKFYKDSTHNMIDLHSLLISNPKISVLAGSDGLIFDIMNAGGVGVVSLVINPFPELVANEVKALTQGRTKDALEIQNKILDIRSVLKKGGHTAGYRYAMELAGIDIGKPRFPYSDIDEKTKELIKSSLKSL